MSLSSGSFSARRDFLKLAGLAGGGLTLASLGPARAAGTDPLSSAATVTPVLGHHWVNVREHGVEAGGQTKNTVALNRLIQAIGAAGGGTLYFPPGLYRTGALHLVSDLTLWLDAGATLVFSEDFDDFLPMVPGRWQGVDVTNFSPLIYGVGLQNVTLAGRGTVDGSGAVWWDYVLKLRATVKATGNVPMSKWQELHRDANGGRIGQSFGFLRPPLLQLHHCTNVRVEGVTFRNAPFWTTHFVNCDGVVVDGITVLTPDSPNTDGINPESSRNVMIANCRLTTDDDCITIKAGKRYPGSAGAFAPCENITITNCVMTKGASGVGIGSEMSGSVRRVSVTNCVIDGTHSGIHIKTVRGRGGVVEDVDFSNLVINNITSAPVLHLNMLYWEKTSPQPVTEATPRFRNIRFNNIRGNSLQAAALVEGLEEMQVENVSFNHLDLAGRTGFLCRQVDGLRLNDVRVDAAEGPALQCDRVNRLDVAGFAPLRADPTLPVIDLQNVTDASLDRSGYVGGATPYVRIAGAATRHVRLRDADLTAASGAVAVATEVPAKAVRWPA